MGVYCRCLAFMSLSKRHKFTIGCTEADWDLRHEYCKLQYFCILFEIFLNNFIIKQSNVVKRHKSKEATSPKKNYCIIIVNKRLYDENIEFVYLV